MDNEAKKHKLDDPLEERVRFYSRSAGFTACDVQTQQAAMDAIFHGAMAAVQEVAKKVPHDKGRMIAAIDTLEHARTIAHASIGLRNTVPLETINAMESVPDAK